MTTLRVQVKIEQDGRLRIDVPTDLPPGGAEIEFQAYRGLTVADEKLFADFRARVSVVGVGTNEQRLVDEVIRPRRRYRIKLSDAIIAASAMENCAAPLTRDADFGKIEGLVLYGIS